MSQVFVCGLGAVSPAGWGVSALRSALEKGEPLPVSSLPRPGWDQPLKTRATPTPTPRPAFMAHPRLRRASPITHYAASAALEALDMARAAGLPASAKLGFLLCLQSGCVQYSLRYFDEVLKDPATASPLLFPETVFNAPTSHVAALLGTTPLAYTMTGDASVFLVGLSLGADWLLEGRVDACLVVGAEETNWLLADALWHFDHQAVLSGGAGAVMLTRDSRIAMGVELNAITDAQAYRSTQCRAAAARKMRDSLPPGAADELLCDGMESDSRIHQVEKAIWKDWPGARLSPKRILGEGLMAAGAWQCVAACDAVAQGKFPAARASLMSGDQQAIGARFVHV